MTIETTELLLSLIVLLAITAAVLTEFYTRRLSIGPAPTAGNVRRAMISALKQRAGDRKNLNIAELGAGWGGLTLALAKAFPESRIYGYEAAPLPFLIAWLRARLSRSAQVNIQHQDFFDVDFADFDAVLCYLSPHHMQRLKPKLEKELKPGAVVISNAFPIPGWPPDTVQEIKSRGVKKKIYMYTEPSKQAD